MYIARSIEPIITKHLFKGKIIVIYGARQTGKTTVVKKILENSPADAKYYNCDESDIRASFENAQTSTNLKQIIGNTRLIVIDEAQRVSDIGLKLKLLADNFPDQQILATGSSSFDLANKIAEPLTGRTYEFQLFPFSLKELSSVWDKTEMTRQLENLLIYGSYPGVVSASSLEEKAVQLKQLTNQYLFKDILTFGRIRKTDFLEKFCAALALQTGNEVSTNELSSLLTVSKDTITSFLDILEQSFILFRLGSFSRNLRKELAKSKKVFFLDTGIRNILINNLNPLDLRLDKGALWENFVISEIKKRQFWAVSKFPLYFWRTYDRQEIDLIEDKNGKLIATEIKWQKSRKNPPKIWKSTYPNSSFSTITRESFLNHLL